MRKLIHYIYSCFCKHDWEMIFNARVRSEDMYGEYKTYLEKTYCCKSVDLYRK